MMAMLSDTGILVLVIAVVLLFGTSQIPKLARNVAEAGKEFRKAHADAEQESVAVPMAPLTPAPPAQATAARAPGGAGENIVLSRSELDALLAAGRPQTTDHP